MSKFRETNKKIEKSVTEGYKKIETGVLAGYKKIEDRFIDAFLADENESTEEAKARIIKSQEEMHR